jgi:predicted nucleic acid-binding protein
VILVDANVLLDLVTNDPNWAQWSQERLDEEALAGPVLINDVVYAEMSVRYDRIERLEEFLSETEIEIASTPRAALFRAGKAFLQYRANGGVRTGVLPDFFIGAHAEVEGLRLLTRDPSCYRTYFPSVGLVAPPQGWWDQAASPRGSPTS